ncbi:MAG: hypothetical protein QNJ67_03475 [Kiloniellales bacterium]|nr:hypothetical protein [Kiloniellales bacterium]
MRRDGPETPLKLKLPPAGTSWRQTAAAVLAAHVGFAVLEFAAKAAIMLGVFFIGQSLGFWDFEGTSEAEILTPENVAYLRIMTTYGFFLSNLISAFVMLWATQRFFPRANSRQLILLFFAIYVLVADLPFEIFQTYTLGFWSLLGVFLACLEWYLRTLRPRGVTGR